MNQDETLRKFVSLHRQSGHPLLATRDAQRKKQEEGGKTDQGLRSAVTGGAQMDGFIDLFTKLVTQVGIPGNYIFRKKAVELPGFL